jgi:enoyl-CoA hydratase/carnithine racemase
MDALVEYAGPADTGGPYARLTLNSPHNRNALSTTLVNQLHQGLRDASADPAVRAVVLGHAGGTFCAGADLSEGGGGDPRGDRERGVAGRSGSPLSGPSADRPSARRATRLPTPG